MIFLEGYSMCFWGKTIFYKYDWMFYKCSAHVAPNKWSLSSMFYWLSVSTLDSSIVGCDFWTFLLLYCYSFLLSNLLIFAVYSGVLFSWVHKYLLLYPYELIYYHYNNNLLLSLFLLQSFGLKPVLSDTIIATPAFFWLLFSWNIFFQIFQISLRVFLKLKQVSSWTFARASLWRKCAWPLLLILI